MPQGNIQELIIQKTSRKPLHEDGQRDPRKIEENYTINPPTNGEKMKEIWLFDDVLTQGTHFRAAKEHLQKHYSDTNIVGFFIARSVFLPAEL